MITEKTVTATTVVRADPAAAFRLFTDQIDSWWRRGPSYRATDEPMRFEADRLLEGNTEIARVLAWEPGVKLLLEWHAWTFRAGERTEVEVRFEAIGDATRVTVEHRGWQPRRARGGEFRTVVGLWWGALLPNLARLAKARDGF